MEVKNPIVTANIITCYIVIKVSQKKSSQTTDAVQDTKLKEEPRKGIKTATTSYVKLVPQKIALTTIPVTLVNGNKRIK